MNDHYAVELFYPARPQFLEDALNVRLEELGGAPQWATDERGNRWCTVAFPKHAILLPKPATPRCILTHPDTEIDNSAYAPALQQTWDWPEARGALDESAYSLLLIDADATGLPYIRRLDVFEAALQAVLETVPPIAIYWEPCQKFVNPVTYLASRQSGDQHDPLLGPISVRMFNIQGRRRPERVMDTMGLAALGLPDLQCHFADLDPNAVGHLLYEYAYMMIEKGDCIEEGHTVQGLEADDRWKCRREESLVEPKRPVIDLGPGQPHGGNHRAIELEV